MEKGSEKVIDSSENALYIVTSIVECIFSSMKKNFR